MKSEFWESKFRDEGALWSFEPADSALLARDMIAASGYSNLLIPGVGYGRNAGVFQDTGISITGIEISASAIALAKKNGHNFRIHHGSVLDMPFDDEEYDAIFCYALIHLLNKQERRKFLQSCFNQLRKGGTMIFSVISKQDQMYGTGIKISKDRFKNQHGVNVFFYDTGSVTSEFSKFGLADQFDIDEPIKFLEGHKPLRFKFITCKKL